MNRRTPFDEAVNREGPLSVGGLVFEVSRMDVTTSGGDVLKLSPRAYRVLLYLAMNATTVIGKEELLAVCWPDVIVTEDSLTQAISEIRREFGPDLRDRIRTISRRGYLYLPLEAPTQVQAPEGAALDVVGIPDAPKAPARPLSRARAGASALLRLVAIAAACVWLLWDRGGQGHVPTLAIAELKNLSGDAALDYFTSGTTETLAAKLSRSPLLHIVRLTRDESDQAVRTALEAHAADYVLEGAVQRDATTMRLVARLVDADTGADLWGEAFDREADDPLALQDAAVVEVVRTISGERGLIQHEAYEKSWGRDAGSLGEYDYYLRGHQLLWNYTEEDTRKALEIWTEGVARYPKSGFLKIKLGWAYDQLFYLNFSRDPRGDLDRAYALATEGMRTPDLSPLGKAMGHWLMANLENDRNLDPAKAAVHARIAMEMLPNETELRIVMGWVPVVEGHPADAVAQLAGFDPASPNAPFGYANLAWAHFALGDYAKAIEAGQRAGDEPTYGMPILAASYAIAGHVEEARGVVAHLRKLFPMGTLDFYSRYHKTADPDVNAREIAALRLAGLP